MKSCKVSVLYSHVEPILQMLVSRCNRKACLQEEGQATVEAAFLIPVVFLCLLLLLQPGIVLYDRMVMQAAASEACRLLATKTNAIADTENSCKAYVFSRLGSIPPVSCFHVHEGMCSWDIHLVGDESSRNVSVAIANELRPLPLLDVGMSFFGLLNERGNFELEVSRSQTIQPMWVDGVEAGRNPSDWIGAWFS